MVSLDMHTITAVIPAKNEETNIERCIKSVKWCDRILVLWMGNDKTGAIAKKLGAEVVIKNRSGKDDFVLVQKNINWAIDHCTTDWILRIDADEAVTPDLQKEIQKILDTENPDKKTDAVAYGIPRAQYFMGKFLRGGDWAYDRLVRLFRPKYCRYEPLVAVHEQFRVHGTVGYVQNRLLHYSHPKLMDAVHKFRKYTDVEIHDLSLSKPRAFWNMLFQPPYVFLRWMIWHKGFRDGWRGLVAGAMRGWYEWLLYSKYLFGIKR